MIKTKQKLTLLLIALLFASSCSGPKEGEENIENENVQAEELEEETEDGKVEVTNEDGTGYRHDDLIADEKAIDIMAEHIDILSQQVGTEGYELTDNDSASLVNAFHLLESDLGDLYSVEEIEEADDFLVVSVLFESYDFEEILNNLLPFAEKSVTLGYKDIYINLFNYGYIQLNKEKISSFIEEGKMDVDHLAQLHYLNEKLEVN